jgi:hypothetical protein
VKRKLKLKMNYGELDERGHEWNMKYFTFSRCFADFIDVFAIDDKLENERTLVESSNLGSRTSVNYLAFNSINERLYHH